MLKVLKIENERKVNYMSGISFGLVKAKIVWIATKKLSWITNYLS